MTDPKELLDKRIILNKIETMMVDTMISFVRATGKVVISVVPEKINWFILVVFDVNLSEHTHGESPLFIYFIK